MDALPADLALRYLRELSADQLGAVVLDAAGGLLAGDEALAEPARELLATAGEAAELAVRTPSGAAFAARDERHAVVVACAIYALDGLVAHDLRVALADLRGASGAQSPAAGAPHPPRLAAGADPTVGRATAAERLILAAQSRSCP